MAVAIVPEWRLRRSTEATSRTAREFSDLRPWFNALTSAQRNIAELRANGMSPAETASRLGIRKQNAIVTSSQAMAVLREAAAHGPGTTDVSDDVPYPEDVDRPLTRGECASQPRPCPFVSCSHHLYLDVNPLTGSMKWNMPHLEVWEMKESCSLDLADKGGVTLEEVGAAMSLTRERARQIEAKGLRMMGAANGGELSALEDRLNTGGFRTEAKPGCP